MPLCPSFAHEVLDHYRVFPLFPIDPDRTGTRFLRTLALRRLGEAKLPSRRVGKLISGAAALSGGLPRRFLALLADAAKYSDTPDPSPLALGPAQTDQAAGMRRLLVDGDRAVLSAADGTDGLEVPADRKVRLLSQGMLLEYPTDDDMVVRPHPLLRRYLE